MMVGRGKPEIVGDIVAPVDVEWEADSDPGRWLRASYAKPAGELERLDAGNKGRPRDDRHLGAGQSHQRELRHLGAGQSHQRELRHLSPRRRDLQVNTGGIRRKNPGLPQWPAISLPLQPRSS